MLVLSRREGETLILETSDGPIRITLTEYDGQQTRVGIEAPQSVRVLREELLDEAGQSAFNTLRSSTMLTDLAETNGEFNDPDALWMRIIRPALSLRFRINPARFPSTGR